MRAARKERLRSPAAIAKVTTLSCAHHRTAAASWPKGPGPLRGVGGLQGFSGALYGLERQARDDSKRRLFRYNSRGVALSATSRGGCHAAE